MNKNSVIVLFFTLALAVAAQGFDGLYFAEDQVLVKTANSLGKRIAPLDFGVAVSDARLLNPSKENDGSAGLSKMAVSGNQDNVYVLTLAETGRDAVERVLAILNANPAVEIAEPVLYYEIVKTPNDPMYGDQYALERINAPSAWEITTGSADVAVGIIDMGIVGEHPDLAGNLWVNPAPGQNGYVNDAHGYDFMRRVGGIPNDTHGHGVVVSGIIGAKGDNGEGITGVNWDVSLAWMGVSIGDRFISVSAAIEALNYANNNNIVITNNSYGGSGYSRIFHEAICNYNGLFVAAAGNDSRDIDKQPFYPASYDCPNLISVASTDREDKLSVFSNSGANSVDIAAPGSGILSTWLTDDSSRDGPYIVTSGTSMAAPYVAGAAALIKSIRPDYTGAQMREMLIASARQIDGLDGFGILDVYAALRYGVNELINITYDYNDGEREPLVVKSVPGKTPVPPGRPLRDGYVFAGWYTDAADGALFAGEVAESVTLYARWIEVGADASVYALEFPDAVFRREVLRLINSIDGGERGDVSFITDEDRALLASMEYLGLIGMGIRSVIGLKYFTGLTELDCSVNRLSELDVSAIAGLRVLNCHNNNISALDLSGSDALTELNCHDNKLTALDLKEVGALRKLSCQRNELRILDVSDLNSLEELRFSDNRLSEIDVTGLPLTLLVCNDNVMVGEGAVVGFNGEWDGDRFVFHPQKSQYHSEDIAVVNALMEYNRLSASPWDVASWRFVEWNNDSPRRIVGIYLDAAVTGAVSLAGLTALETLYLGNGRLTSLNLSGLRSLKILSIVNGNLPELDVSDLSALEYLNCYGNRLTELNVGNNAELTTLVCANNFLTEIDVGNNINLTFMDCSYNDMADKSAVTGFTGEWDGVNFIFDPQGLSPISVAEKDRAIVDVDNGAYTGAAAVTVPFGRAFTAGPNPAGLSSGIINFYIADPRPVAGCVLTIYDAGGNAVRKINAVNVDGNYGTGGYKGGRIVASWDLKDAKGRTVSAGTYLVRGTIVTYDDIREKVSLIIGVRY